MIRGLLLIQVSRHVLLSGFVFGGVLAFPKGTNFFILKNKLANEVSDSNIKTFVACNNLDPNQILPETTVGDKNACKIILRSYNWTK